MNKLLLSGLAVTLCLTACAPTHSYSEGELAYAQGNYGTAARVFHAYSDYDCPQRIEAMYYYGMCQLRLGDADKADAILARAVRFCEDRALRARIMAGRAEVARQRGFHDGAEAIYEDLRQNYYDVFSAEALAKSRQGEVFTDPLRGEMAVIPGGTEPYQAVNAAADGRLHRVRLTATYGAKAQALAECYRLREAGIEAIVVPLPANVFTVQIGAFRNPRLAAALKDQAARLGWQTAILN